MSGSASGGLTESFRRLTSRRRPPGTFGRWWHGLDKTTRTLISIGLVAYLYLLPKYPPPLIKTPQSDWSTVLASGMVIYALVALGLNVVVGWCGLLDLGYVGFYAVGVYTAAVLGSQHASLPWLLCVPIAITVSMLFGVVLGTPTLRLRGDYLAIVTLGFGEIIHIVAVNSNWLGSTRGIKDIPAPPNIGPLKFDTSDAKGIYYLGLTIIIITVFLLHRLERSRVGRAWTTIREDEDAAELMGVPTFRFKLWAFAIGAAIGGLAGMLNAGIYPGYISPTTFELRLSILFLAAVVLGGTGNMYGAILGGALVAYLPERFRNFADKRYFVFGVILVIMMVVRPEGLIPRRGRAGTVEIVDQPESPGMVGAPLEESLGYRGTKSMTEKLLEMDHVTMRFGGVTALDDVDFDIERGEILGLIGPNGAGKTTCFNVMTAVYEATRGEVRFLGKPLAGMKRYQITKIGIARTFQNIRLFPEMSALENVMVGADTHHRTSVWHALLHLPRHTREEREGKAAALELLEFMGIADRAEDAARNLPYGYQRRLEIARALATKPQLVCLDEPAAGFNPAEKQELMGLIRSIRDQGYTVLVIEHDMSLVMGVTDRIVVLDFGRKIAEGVPADIQTDQRVIEAYLGAPDPDDEEEAEMHP